MSLARIASRYAKSLIDFARDSGKLDVIYADIKQIEIACGNKDFLLLCKSPIIPSTKKAQVFKTLFENNLDPISFNYFNILVRKGREQYVPEIVSEFIKQYEKINKKTRVKLITAEILDQSTVDLIQSKLTHASTTRDNIELETSIDPNLIGGFILEYDDNLYDASVSNQLRLMRKSLTSDKKQ